MRKHHNKLFYGVYTHKTVFKMPWAQKLFPTTDENLIKYVKGQKNFFGQHHPDLTDLAVYIMETRHNIKFRVQKDHTLFYSDFETALEIITKYWKYFTNVISVNLAHTNKLQKKIHPDVNPNSNTERLSQIVNEAKETILKYDFS